MLLDGADGVVPEQAAASSDSAINSRFTRCTPSGMEDFLSREVDKARTAPNLLPKKPLFSIPLHHQSPNRETNGYGRIDYSRHLKSHSIAEFQRVS
jgi:hypothetical protein